jgi:UDP-2,4-diacetamido-2,4,6-trideoxy-beta-L-altropyranose hydrolase
MCSGTLIIRADASPVMGTGHVMRCLALAQVWQDGADLGGANCIFAMVEPMPALEQRVRSEGFDVVALSALPGSMEDAAQLTELARKRDARWIVVDGYQFAAEYHRTLKDAGPRVLLVDDHGHTGAYFADLVLDQNSGANISFYERREPYTKLLLGLRYAMLRREFHPWRKYKREIASGGRNLLITMGGSDPEGLTQRAIQAFDSLHIDEWQATVVVGASNPRLPKLRELVQGFEGRVRLEVDPGNMAELMAGTDLAVSSAGSTCWEMCMVGLPAIVIDAADNQLPIASELARRQISLHIPFAQATPDHIAASLESLLGSTDLRKQMSEHGQELVDGCGADRVVAAMLACSMIMRPVEARDCRMLWEWANDRMVRQVSFSSAAIPWEEHGRWFSEKLHDPTCLFLMFEDDGNPAGTARIQCTTAIDAEISVTIAPQYRGRGLASHLIEQAIDRAFANFATQRVHALVKPDNLASSKSFESSGFFLVGTTTVNAYEALHYIREREAGLRSQPTYPDRASDLVRCR